LFDELVFASFHWIHSLCLGLFVLGLFAYVSIVLDCARMLHYCNMMRWAWCDWGRFGWLTTVRQCLDTVGWVIEPYSVHPQSTVPNTKIQRSGPGTSDKTAGECRKELSLSTVVTDRSVLLSTGSSSLWARDTISWWPCFYWC